jgi:hypothetical protein
MSVESVESLARNRFHQKKKIIEFRWWDLNPACSIQTTQQIKTLGSCYRSFVMSGNREIKRNSGQKFITVESQLLRITISIYRVQVRVTLLRVLHEALPKTKQILQLISHPFNYSFRCSIFDRSSKQDPM